MINDEFYNLIDILFQFESNLLISELKKEVNIDDETFEKYINLLKNNNIIELDNDLIIKLYDYYNTLDFVSNIYSID